MMLLHSKDLVIFVVVLLDAAWAFHIQENENLLNDITDAENEEALLTCSCGSLEQVVEIPLDVSFAERFFQPFSLTRRKIFEILKNNSPIHGYIEKCESCQITTITCFGNGSLTDNYSCIKKSVDFLHSETQNSVNGDETLPHLIGKRNIETFPKLIDIPIGGVFKSREGRQLPEACAFPSSMTTVAISCREFPSFINCIQRCAFGHTYENGIEKELRCIKTENKWKPTGFHECQPFVDCTLSLTSGGSAVCSSPSLLKGPECSVECSHFEDKPAVPKQSYICYIDGTWDPPLPFCASPRTGLVLVKAPILA